MEEMMTNDLTRRDALALGLSAATLAATGASAQTATSAIKVADAPAPSTRCSSTTMSRR
jgi:multiple sugar transport system substrate-binding protein